MRKDTRYILTHINNLDTEEKVLEHFIGFGFEDAEKAREFIHEDIHAWELTVTVKAVKK